MPASKKSFDLLGDDIVEFSTENESLKKIVSYDEKWLAQSKANLLKQRGFFNWTVTFNFFLVDQLHRYFRRIKETLPVMSYNFVSGKFSAQFLMTKIIKNRRSNLLYRISFNEFKLLSDNESLEEVLVRKTVETAFQILYDKGLFDSFHT